MTLFDTLPEPAELNAEGFARPAGNFGTLAVMVGKFEYTDITAKTLFSLPAGAVPVWWVVDVVTDFDAGTLNDLDIGFDSDADYFADALAIGTADTFDPTEANAVNGRLGVQLNTDGTSAITALYIPTGTASSQGEANVVMFYFVSDDDYTIA